MFMSWELFHIYRARASWLPIPEELLWATKDEISETLVRRKWHKNHKVQQIYTQVRNAVWSDYYIFEKLDRDVHDDIDIKAIVIEVRRKNIILSAPTLARLLNFLEIQEDRDRVFEEFFTHYNADSSVIFAMTEWKTLEQVYEFIEQYKLKDHVTEVNITSWLSKVDSFEIWERLLEDFRWNMNALSHINAWKFLCTELIANWVAVPQVILEKYRMWSVYLPEKNREAIRTIIDDSELPIKMKMIFFIYAQLFFPWDTEIPIKDFWYLDLLKKYEDFGREVQEKMKNNREKYASLFMGEQSTFQMWEGSEIDNNSQASTKLQDEKQHHIWFFTNTFRKVLSYIFSKRDK